MLCALVCVQPTSAVREAEEERRDYHTQERQNPKEIKDLAKVMGGLQSRAENRAQSVPSTVKWSHCLVIYQCICLLFLGSGCQQDHLGMYCFCTIYLNCTCIIMVQAAVVHSIIHEQKRFTDPRSLLSK